MKKIKGLMIIFIIATLILGIVEVPVRANDFEVSIEFSEDFKKWEQLSDEEKANTLMPNITANNIADKDRDDANSIFYGIKNIWTKAVTPDKYILTDEINVPIKHQGSTMECWAFSMTSALESYLAMSGQQVVPRYSERYMDFVTSKTFADGTNPIGYNREIGQGGNTIIALGYLTNGTGAVLEEDMPFVDNDKDRINLSEIQGKKPQTRVTDAVVFPNINKSYDSSTGEVSYYDDSYNTYSEDEVTTIRNKIKEHIMKYGAVSAVTYGSGAQYYSNPSDPMHSEAYYCDNTFLAPIDHAITIIGWDDDYSVDNFNPEHKPKNPGAYICLNSYGEESFADGLLYVSYDDTNIEKNLTGITGTDEIDDTEKIYQNDFYGRTLDLNFNPTQTATLGIANVFTRDTSDAEEIREIQICVKGQYTPEVYINPNGDSLTDNLEKVELLNDNLDGTYNTLVFKNPVKVTGDKFAIVVNLVGSGTLSLGLECNLKDVGLEENNLFASVTANKGESFINDGSWRDFTEFSLQNYTFSNSNICMKAIAVPDDETDNPDENTNTDNNTNNPNENTNTDNNTNNPNENTNTDNGTNNPNENTNTDNNTDNPDENTNTDNNSDDDKNNNKNTGTTNNNNNNESNSQYYYNGTVDRTVANGKLPYTGGRLLRIVLPIGLIIMLISYVNYRKYKDIKNK